MCLAFNNHGAIEKEFEISVLEAPTIIEPVDRELIIRNSTFSLTCIARGNPIPKFSWGSEKYVLGMTGDFDQLESSIYFDSFGNVIKNFDEHKFINGLSGTSKLSKVDSKTYKFEMFLKFKESMKKSKFNCLAINSEGEAEKQISILKLDKPYLVNYTKDDFTAINLNFFEGKSLIIECPLNANPHPSFIWRKDGRQVDSTDHLEFLEGGRTLFTKEAAGNHSGSYSCIANNTEGRHITLFEVFVSTPPKFEDNKSEQKIEVLKGRDASLECLSTGNPKPETYWMLEKRGKVVEKKSLDEHRSFLVSN